jgi:hypothetical protein
LRVILQKDLFNSCELKEVMDRERNEIKGFSFYQYYPI